MVTSSRTIGVMVSISRVSMPWGMRLRTTAKGSTDTVSPAATSPRSSSITTKQLASVIEVRMPEPWGPVVRTSHRAPE